jgi:Tol biopolymer transport system component
MKLIFMPIFMLSFLTHNLSTQQKETDNELKTRTISFTTSECTYCGFDISPDGRWIVFDLLGQLWRIPATGGDAVRLTDAVSDLAEHAFPAISPDGREVAFVVDQPDGRGLFVVPVQGGEPRRLTSADGPEMINSAPAWSPDGKRIAYIKGGELWIVDRESGDQQAAATRDGTPIRFSGARWTEDLTHVPFLAWPRDGRQLLVSYGGTMFRVNPETGESSVAGGAGSVPSPSPDGLQLGFLVHDETERTQVWLLEHGAKEPRRLTDHPDVTVKSLRWSPDGRDLLYSAQGCLWRVSAEGSDPAVIPFRATLVFEQRETAPRPVRFPDPDTDQLARGHMGLALSPDGESIAMIVLGRLWTFAPGDEPREVAALPSTATGLTWSPDALEVAWSGGRGGEESLFATDVRTGATRQLTSLPGMAIKPSWSPDGSRIAFIHWIIPEPETPPGDPARRSAVLRVIDARRPMVQSLEEAPSLGSVPVQWTFRGSRFTQELPQWSPDGSSLLLGDRFVLASPESGSPRQLRSVPERMGFAQWCADGSLVFVENYRLVVIDFDADSDAPPAPRSLGEDPAMYVSASARGDLLYVSEDGLRLRRPDGSIDLLGWPISFRTREQPEPLLIRGARVISGDGTPLLPPSDVLIRNGRISAIGATGTILPPPDAELLEAWGKILMPGLIDMHTHLWGNSVLPSLLYAGVTTARDLGSPVAHAAGLRDARDAGILEVPRLLFGSLQFSERFDGFSGDGYGGPSDKEGFERAVAILRALGAQNLKWRPDGNIAEGVQLMAVATRKKLPVSGHRASLPMIAAGMAGKEHASGLQYNDMVRLFAAAGVWVVPTLVQASQNLRVSDNPLYIDGELPAALVDPFLQYIVRSDAQLGDMDFLQTLGETARRQVGRLHQEGVTVLAGSDAPGQIWALHWELEDFVAAGIGALDAITAATGAAARALGVQDEIGTVEVGKLADLILLDADPLEDIRNTREIWKIIKDGRVVDREGILEWAKEETNY